MRGGALLRFVARPLLAALWALVAWGHLLVLATAWRAVQDGLRPALALLLPAPQASFWAWLNLVSVGLVFLVWLAGLAALQVRRSAGPDDRP